MANRTLFIGWNRPTPGKEKQAAQLFQKTLQFYGKLVADGRIESFEPVILSAHGGNLNGFMLLRGDSGKIAKLREDDDFMDMVIEAELCLDGVGIVLGYIGDGLMEIFSRWMKQAV